MRVVEVRALVITMHYSLAQAQLKIPCDTLRDVETDASADTLPDTVADLKREKSWRDRSTCEHCIRSLNAVGTLADVETKTVGKLLGKVEVEALPETSSDTLSQVVAKTIANSNHCVGEGTGQKQKVTLLQMWKLT